MIDYRPVTKVVGEGWLLQRCSSLRRCYRSVCGCCLLVT